MPIITLLKICMQVLKWNLTEFLLLKKQDVHKHINTLSTRHPTHWMPQREVRSEVEKLTEKLLNFKTFRF